ncbi:hypothetical protein L915_13306 [Phytophthora nicotianae]|uniref:Uncharacterized protein n=1 Tax=Phytophthora nicotianae TaxID=4792 RepID=W2IM64_PHYNI|nr:hypothetical protein L915_13306 [Phytophthora nicotianae]ETL34607.1 hypothetical protein L916_13192 [Phytophthora nicotianae]
MQNLPELKRLQRLDEAENNALKKLCQHSSIFTGCGKPTEQQTQDDRMIVFRHEAVRQQASHYQSIASRHYAGTTMQQSDNMGVEVMNLADSDQSEADE